MAFHAAVAVKGELILSTVDQVMAYLRDVERAGLFVFPMDQPSAGVDG